MSSRKPLSNFLIIQTATWQVDNLCWTRPGLGIPQQKLPSPTAAAVVPHTWACVLRVSGFYPSSRCSATRNKDALGITAQVEYLTLKILQVFSHFPRTEFPRKPAFSSKLTIRKAAEAVFAWSTQKLCFRLTTREMLTQLWFHHSTRQL